VTSAEAAGARAGVFDLYAACYDLLYRDKDYAAEARWVASLLPAGRALSILELGCGTGGHALELARAGHRVHGIDLAPRMVARARERAAAAAACEPALAARLAFDEGDVRSVRTRALHDAVISLFHVMSYQTGDADLEAAFTTARAHLAPGGDFVFDFWHGPAVLADPPRQVAKDVADERVRVQRRTTPTLHAEAHRVDVRFDLDVSARDGSAAQQFVEVHVMRFLFLPEIERLLGRSGFALRLARAWMQDVEPDARHWYACVAARAT
jgi:SAM-dependent methyltransferase